MKTSRARQLALLPPTSPLTTGLLTQWKSRWTLGVHYVFSLLKGAFSSWHFPCPQRVILTFLDDLTRPPPPRTREFPPFIPWPSFSFVLPAAPRPSNSDSSYSHVLHAILIQSPFAVDVLVVMFSLPGFSAIYASVRLRIALNLYFHSHLPVPTSLRLSGSFPTSTSFHVLHNSSHLSLACVRIGHTISEVPQHVIYIESTW